MQTLKNIFINLRTYQPNTNQTIKPVITNSGLFYAGVVLHKMYHSWTKLLPVCLKFIFIFFRYFLKPEPSWWEKISAQYGCQVMIAATNTTAIATYCFVCGPSSFDNVLRLGGEPG